MVKRAEILVVIVASGLLMLTGCASSEAGNDRASTTLETPIINLVSPSTGQELPSDQIEITVEISGFQIDPYSVGKAKVNGQGHWHLYLDGEFVQAVVQDQILLEPLPQGPHHVRVSLANNDHSPLTPPVEDSVVVDIIGGNGIAATNKDFSN